MAVGDESGIDVELEGDRAVGAAGGVFLGYVASLEKSPGMLPERQPARNLADS
jgi:hypothetical protein